MIDETLAIDIAKKRAQEKGWGFDEPFQVVARKRWYGLFGSIKQYEIEAHSGRPNIKANGVCLPPTYVSEDRTAAAAADKPCWTEPPPAADFLHASAQLLWQYEIYEISLASVARR